MIARQSSPASPFNDEVAALYAPAKRYVERVTELMLRHVWCLAQNEGNSVADQFKDVAWLGRLLTLDHRVCEITTEEQVTDWIRIRGQLIDALDDCKGPRQLEKSIQKCQMIVGPILKERFVEGYRFGKRQFGCWWYTIHEAETVMAVHLVNSFVPDSPFDHLAEFSGDLLRAINDAVSKHPKICHVKCGSWLNQTKEFQRLWPESFKPNQEVLDARGGFGPGAWGQYMSSDGGFNETRASYLLEKGLHPYALTEACCDIDSVTAHLKNKHLSQ